MTCPAVSCGRGAGIKFGIQQALTTLVVLMRHLTAQICWDGFRSLGKPDAGALALLESMPGEGDDLILRGGSAIISSDTSYIQGPLFDQPGILCAEIRPERLAEGHLTLDTAGHYSRPDVFQLKVDNRPQEQ